MIGGEIADIVPEELKERKEPFQRTYEGEVMERPRWLLDTERFSERAPDREAARALARPSLATITGGLDDLPVREPGRPARPRTIG